MRTVGVTTTHDGLPDADLAIDNFLNAELDPWLRLAKASLLNRPAAMRGGCWRCRWPARRSRCGWNRLRRASAADFSPAYAGKIVAVKGLVSSPPISFLDYQQLAIQEGGSGLILEGASGDFRQAESRRRDRGGGQDLRPRRHGDPAPAEPPRVLFHGAAPAPEAGGSRETAQHATTWAAW